MFFGRMSKYITLDTVVLVKGNTFKFKELRNKSTPCTKNKVHLCLPLGTAKDGIFIHDLSTFVEEIYVKNISRG
jgi:hypothetical protein